MFATTVVALLSTAFQAPDAPAKPWVAVVSREGNFVVDMPKPPTENFTRTSRTRGGRVRTTVIQCDTEDVLYVAEKVQPSRTATNLKKNEAEALLEYWRDSLANEFNGRVITQKKISYGPKNPGRDFTIEGRPVENKGLATIRVREFFASNSLYILYAVTAADAELPQDVGRFFASFNVGTHRTKKYEPYPEPTGQPFGKWGVKIDPDNDCQFKDLGNAVEISVPNTWHDVNADTGKLNGPRIMREVSGDFTVTVKVSGTFSPGTKGTKPRTVPCIGGGILVWLDSNNYIFLDRFAINRGGKVAEYAAFEEREWGTRAAVNNKGGLPVGKPLWVRLERRGDRILGSISGDGKNWMRLDPMDTSYPSTVKVGFSVINCADQPITVRFDNFTLKEGRGSSGR